MTLDPSIRQKVIDLHTSGKTRDQIVYTLNTESIRVSAGSVSNILKQWRQQNIIEHKPEEANLSIEGPKTIEPQIKDPEVDIKPNDIVNLDVTQWQDETIEEEEVEQSDKPDITLPTPNTIDWDSNAMWERKLIRAWGERSQQLRLIENGKHELEEERQQIELMKQSVMQQIDDLRIREEKVAAVELLIPLARQLQIMKVDVRNFIPWSEMVRRYAMNHNVDLTTAAFDVKKILEAFRELEFLQNEIKKSEAYWSALCEATRDHQKAIADLKYLRRAGCGKRDFKKLGEVIRGQRLDTELVDVGTPKNDGSSHPTHLTQGNGNNNLSMNNYLGLQLLQASTSNILNKMGVKN